jgi:hypothetical protein
MKIRSFFLPLLLLLFLNKLQSQSYSFKPIPPSVKEVGIPDNPSVSKYDVLSGFYLTLADYQINLEENKTFSRQVINVISYGGITNASQLAIALDTSYQHLNIHHLYIWRKGKRIDRTDSLSFENMNNEQNLNKGIYTGQITIYDILKITIPALLFFITSWVLVRNLLKNDQDKRKQELILQNSRTVTPIKLQAYERIVLFLERISLESLLIRVNTPGMSAGQLHSALLTTIRSEFEHNLSQQIYMSPQAWEVVRNARSNMTKIINSEFEKMKDSSGAMEFSKNLLESVMGMDVEPTRAAIDYIKGEIGRMI